MKEVKNKRDEGSLWLVVHSHCHGASAYVARCRRMPTEAEAIETFGIDHEPEEGDSIEIQPAKVMEIRIRRLREG